MGRRPRRRRAGRLVGFDWTFGDGGRGSGMTVTRTYSRAGSFSVTLTVTDDLGKTAAKSTTVTIGAGQAPTADFVFSPASPKVNTDVNFNAGTTTAPPGRTIQSYAWNFGDGETRNGVTVSEAVHASRQLRRRADGGRQRRGKGDEDGQYRGAALAHRAE